MGEFKLKRDHYGYLFIAPFVIAFLIFGLYPIFNTFYLSFTDKTLLGGEANFVGLRNFERLFADNIFMNAVINTWRLWLLNFIPQIGIAMLLSVWFTSLRLRIRAVGIWRAIFFLPNLLMPAAVAALYFSLFSFYGPVNQIMVRAGLLPEAMQFLQDSTVARSLVIFIQWWMWWGLTIILLMAGRVIGSHWPSGIYRILIYIALGAAFSSVIVSQTLIGVRAIGGERQTRR